MKKILLLVILFVTPFIGICKEIYFYTNSTDLVQNVRVRGYNGDNQILDLRESQWVRLNVGEVKTYFIEFKSGTYFGKKTITVNLSTKEVAFVKIHLEQMSWAVYEQKVEDAPIEIQEDFIEFMGQKMVELNKKIHPKTDWNEGKIRNRLTSKSDQIEGVYEGAFTTTTMVKYKLGIIKEADNSYKAIYLGGGDPKIWNVGDLKATLIPTATPYLFKANWYMANKFLNDEMYISFKDGSFTAIEKSEENIFIKMFPIATQDDSSGGPSSGTGFALTKNGFVVTNHHVIEERKEIFVKGIDNDFSKSYKATVVASDSKNDLVILRITDAQFSSSQDLPYSLELKVGDVGSSVFTLGYPLRTTMGDEVKLTNGIISSKTGFQGDITTYQVSTPVQPGNSGGPLFDDNGNVVGIVNAKHAGAEGVSYAIKSLYLYNLMQSIDGLEVLDDSNSIRTLPLSGKVKSLRNFVYIIEAR